MGEPEPHTADPATSATTGSDSPPAREFQAAALQQKTNARWKAGDTGMFKKTPTGYIMAGAEAATKLGLESGVDGWTPFTVVPDERMNPCA